MDQTPPASAVDASRTPAEQLVRREGLEEAPLQGEMLLFDAASGKFFLLNPTMAYIWAHLDGQHSSEQLRDGLCREFESADAGVVEANVAEGLAELLSLGLILESQQG